MTVFVPVLDVRKLRLVQADVQRLGVVTQRSSDEFGSRLSIVVARLDELLYAYVRLERGLDTIDVIQSDPGKVWHGYIVSVVQRLHRPFQPPYVASSMQGQTAEET